MEALRQENANLTQQLAIRNAKLLHIYEIQKKAFLKWKANNPEKLKAYNLTYQRRYRLKKKEEKANIIKEKERVYIAKRDAIQEAKRNEEMGREDINIKPLAKVAKVAKQTKAQIKAEKDAKNKAEKAIKGAKSELIYQKMVKDRLSKPPKKILEPIIYIPEQPKQNAEYISPEAITQNDAMSEMISQMMRGEKADQDKYHAQQKQGTKQALNLPYVHFDLITQWNDLYLGRLLEESPTTDIFQNIKKKVLSLLKSKKFVNIPSLAFFIKQYIDKLFEHYGSNSFALSVIFKGLSDIVEYILNTGYEKDQFIPPSKLDYDDVYKYFNAKNKKIIYKLTDYDNETGRAKNPSFNLIE